MKKIYTITMWALLVSFGFFSHAQEGVKQDALLVSYAETLAGYYDEFEAAVERMNVASAKANLSEFKLGQSAAVTALNNMRDSLEVTFNGEPQGIVNSVANLEFDPALQNLAIEAKRVPAPRLEQPGKVAIPAGIETFPKSNEKQIALNYLPPDNEKDRYVHEIWARVPHKGNLAAAVVGGARVFFLDGTSQSLSVRHDKINVGETVGSSVPWKKNRWTRIAAFEKPVQIDRVRIKARSASKAQRTKLNMVFVY